MELRDILAAHALSGLMAATIGKVNAQTPEQYAELAYRAADAMLALRAKWLSRPQVANIEVGRSDLPISRFALFAKALGVPMKELIP